MPEYRHVIWDWNGTLLNDSWLCVELLNKALHRHGLPRVTEEYGQGFCIPIVDYYKSLGFDFERESYEELAGVFIEEYNRRRCECSLQDGALEVLNGFREAGIEQSILSAYQQETLQEVVDMFDLRNYFTHIIGLGDYFGGSKIENGRRLIGMLDYAPECVLLIGDMVHDYRVACEIGVDCILIPGGFQSRQRLVETGCKVIDCVGELAKI